MQLDRYKPGDLVFFAGRKWQSRVIALRTCSWHQLLVERRWISHVGILFEHEQRLMLGESTTLCDLPCEISGTMVRGVQAHVLEQRLAGYHGQAWICRLAEHRKLEAAKAQQLAQKIAAACGKVPYDKSGAIFSGTRWLKFARWHYEDLSAVFCSEFVRSLYESLGLLPEDNASNCTPAGLYREVRYLGVCVEPEVVR